MSYILDALQRADAERERGQVPGLHSQTTRPPPPEGPQGSPVQRMVRWWTLLLGAGLLCGAGLWWFATRQAPASPPAQPPVDMAQGPEKAPPPPGAEMRVEAPPPVIGPAPALPPPPSPQTRPADAAPVSPLLAPPPPPPAPARRETPPGANPAPEVKAAADAPSTRPAPSPSPTDKAEPAPRLTDLAPAQRGQIPTLSLSGGSYSANPAHRMLIVNGKVLQEGQEAAPGLRLERIGPHDAVFVHRGTRFSVSY